MARSDLEILILKEKKIVNIYFQALHCPSIFAVKAKFYGVLFLVIGQRQKAPNFSAFHWSDFHWSAFRYHEGSTFTEKDRNKLNYRNGPKRTYSPNRTRVCRPCIAASCGH